MPKAAYPHETKIHVRSSVFVSEQFHLIKWSGEDVRLQLKLP